MVDGVAVAVRAEPGATIGDLRRGLAGIGLPDAPLSVGVTRSGSSPATAKTARAKPNQLVSPEFVPW